MQTYGRKWRTKSACVNGHVVNRSGAPFMRLNSTGDVTSVDHNSWAAADLGVQPVNTNPCNMTTFANSRVGHWTGLKASNLTHSKTGIDVNATMFESLVDKVSISHSHDQKLMQPRCGIAGWNYNGSNLGKSSNIGVFPCHQFINSFNCAQSGHPRTLGPIHNSESAGLGTPLMRMENQHNQQRRPRYDSSYRSPMPKQHRAELAKKASEYPSSEPTRASNSNCPQMESVKPSRETLSLSDAHTDCIATDLSSMSTKMYRICQSKETNTMAQKHCEDRVSSAVDALNGVNIDQDITITCVESCDKPKVDCCNSSVRTAKTCQDKVKQFTVNMRSKGAVTGSCGASQNAGEREPTNVTGSCCSSQNSRAGDPTLVKSDSNIHVLFIRKNLKRGRAPASKQRRRKQQKARATASCCPDNKAPPGGKLVVECSVDIGGDSTQDDKCGKSLSFYLGVSPSSDLHSVPNGRSLCSDFVVSFSDDDDDYDSVDGDWGDVEAELTQCNLFNYLPSAQSPLNFEVRISPVSSSENLQNKVLEDINTSWNVQISVKDHKQSSKKSGKKVHFPEDKHLSVVHPMVVWSYAYKSARKGHWENFVRDRNRFQRRIQDLEDTLVPVLDSEHRQQVLERRQDHNALTSGTPN